MTTICIVGFPDDAVPRELENLCRYMPGFVAARVCHQTVFAKFVSAFSAQTARAAMHRSPFDYRVTHTLMKAEFARRELDVGIDPSRLILASDQDVAPHPEGGPRLNDRWPTPRDAAPLQRFEAPREERARFEAPREERARFEAPREERARFEAPRQERPPSLRDTYPVSAPAGNDVDTLAVFRTKGYAEDQMKEWAINSPDFVTYKTDEQTGLMFIKFSGPEAARAALDEALGAGIRAEWARRNLDVDEVGEPAKKRQRVGEEIVTLTVSASPDRDWDWIADLLERQRGFDTLKLAERAGRIFARFSSRDDADRAIKKLTAEGFSAAWARRNLEELEFPASTPAPTPTIRLPPASTPRSLQGGPEGAIDTIVVLGAKQKGVSEESVREWFERQRGYIELQESRKTDAIFIKFADNDAADRALQNATEWGVDGGISVEWARTNLSRS